MTSHGVRCPSLILLSYGRIWRFNYYNEWRKLQLWIDLRVSLIPKYNTRFSTPFAFEINLPFNSFHIDYIVQIYESYQLRDNIRFDRTSQKTHPLWQRNTLRKNGNPWQSAPAEQPLYKIKQSTMHHWNRRTQKCRNYEYIPFLLNIDALIFLFSVGQDN